MVDEHRQRLIRNRDILTHVFEQIAQTYARHITLPVEAPRPSEPATTSSTPTGAGTGVSIGFKGRVARRQDGPASRVLRHGVRQLIGDRNTTNSCEDSHTEFFQAEQLLLSDVPRCRWPSNRSRRAARCRSLL